MTRLATSHDPNVKPAFAKASLGKTRTALSPLTLRLTRDERTRLEELAAGMTLSAYVRACVFAENTKRPKSPLQDKKSIAEALALLGQSRIASNLNQLAYHANIGALEMTAKERDQIEEAYALPPEVQPDLFSRPTT